MRRWRWRWKNDLSSFFLCQEKLDKLFSYNQFKHRRKRRKKNVANLLLVPRETWRVCTCNENNWGRGKRKRGRGSASKRMLQKRERKKKKKNNVARKKTHRTTLDVKKILASYFFYKHFFTNLTSQISLLAMEIFSTKNLHKKKKLELTRPCTKGKMKRQWTYFLKEVLPSRFECWEIWRKLHLCFKLLLLLL